MQLEDESSNEFRRLLPSAWIVRDKTPDVGIDLEIEIVEGEEVTNKTFLVQLKATESTKSTSAKIFYSMKTKNLKYYENCRTPVIIVIWVKPTREFFYIFAQQYINELLSFKNPNWRAQKTCTIEFPLDSKITDVSVLNSVAVEGYFYVTTRILGLADEMKGAFYWLDGIPKSDDEELKDSTLKALSFLRERKFFEAKEEFEKALRLYTITPTQKISLLLNLGLTFFFLGDQEKALTYYYNTLELSKKVPTNEVLDGKAATFANIGTILRNKGELSKSLDSFRDAKKIYCKLNDKKNEANILNEIGSILWLYGDLEKTLKIFQEAKTIFTRLGYKFGEALTLCNIGLVYRDQGKAKDALDVFQNSLKIFSEIGHKQGMASSLNNIGLVFREMGELERAKDNFIDANEIGSAVGDNQLVLNTLNNIGLIFSDQFNFEAALNIFNKSLENSRTIGYKKAEINSLNNIGLVYLYRGELDAAEKAFDELVGICLERGYKREQINALNNLGLVNYHKGRLQNALTIIQESLSASS